MKKVIVLTLICLLACLARVSAQGDTTLVAKNLRLARELTDRGLYDESIALLDATDEIDPARTALYSYERGYAQFLKGDYPSAIRSLSRVLRFRDASDSVFRLLGDCYLFSGDIDMALETYIGGLQDFPDSGRLYYGIGKIRFSDGEYGVALDCFLDGLYHDPAWGEIWCGRHSIYTGRRNVRNDKRRDGDMLRTRLGKLGGDGGIVAGNVAQRYRSFGETDHTYDFFE